MPNQSELSDPKPYVFFENLTEGGQLKTKNVPSTSPQRNVITNRGKDTLFKANVSLITCVHGEMNEDERTPASLVVLEFHVGCSGKHRYSSLTTSITFKSQQPQALEDEPFVKAYAPFKLSEMKDSVDLEHTNKTSGEGSAGVTYPPAHATTKITKEVEKKKKLSDGVHCQAFPGFTDGKRGYDQVTWDLKENASKSVGVPDTFRVAILIERANADKFIGTFSLDLHAGFWFAAKETFKKVCGIAETDDPIVFDPSLGPHGETAGITPMSLGVFADPGKLQELSLVHLV